MKCVNVFIYFLYLSSSSCCCGDRSALVGIVLIEVCRCVHLVFVFEAVVVVVVVVTEKCVNVCNVVCNCLFWR